MLKCIVVSTPGAKFSALALKDDFKDSLKKVADLGYDAVELAVRNPKLLDISGIKELLQKYNLTVPAIGTGQAYGEEGLSFTHLEEEVRKQAVQRIKDQMDFSVAVGGAQVIIGPIRGTVYPDVERERAERYFIQSIKECADYNPKVTLTLEPVNRYETNLYNSIPSMLAIIDQIDRPNIKMLIDTFHMNIEEPNMIESILKAKDYIAHVHFADSNRWAPGCGHINFPEIIKTLQQINYGGAISAEILPEPSPEESVRLTIEYYKKLGL